MAAWCMVQGQVSRWVWGRWKRVRDLEALASQEGRVRFGPQASRGCVPGSRMGRSAGPWHGKGWPSARFSGSGRNARSSG